MMDPPWARRLLRTLDRPHAGPKSRDWWDKAPVLTSVLSSVVIALVGLYVSSTFQKSQLAITKESNAAQLVITTEKNKSDIRLQELKLASDLMESLVSQDPKRRRIAALMLPSALSNHEMCQRILTALADDSDSSVRVAAITKLGEATTHQSAVVLDAVNRDQSRPQGERRLARDLAVKVALNSNLPTNSAFLFASIPGGYAYENEDFKGGVFTKFLTEGLTGAADSNGDGRIGIGELSHYVDLQMPKYGAAIGAFTRGLSLDPILPKENDKNDRFRPFLELSGSPDLVVVDLKGTTEVRRIALVVGVSRYSSKMASLRYASSDAHRFADSLNRLGIQTTKLIDPTYGELTRQVKRMTASLSRNDIFYFYFSGHGWSVSGENMLGPADTNVSSSGITGGFSIEELKSSMRSANANAFFAFFDVCRNEISVTR